MDGNQNGTPTGARPALRHAAAQSPLHRDSLIRKVLFNIFAGDGRRHGWASPPNGIPERVATAVESSGRSAVADPVFMTKPACNLREQSSIVLLRGLAGSPVRRFASKLCAVLALSRKLRLDGTGLSDRTVFIAREKS